MNSHTLGLWLCLNLSIAATVYIQKLTFVLGIWYQRHFAVMHIKINYLPPLSELITNIYTRGHIKPFDGNWLLIGFYERKASDCNWLIGTVSAQCAGVVVFVIADAWYRPEVVKVFSWQQKLPFEVAESAAELASTSFYNAYSCIKANQLLLLFRELKHDGRSVSVYEIIIFATRAYINWCEYEFVY